MRNTEEYELSLIEDKNKARVERIKLKKTQIVNRIRKSLFFGKSPRIKEIVEEVKKSPQDSISLEIHNLNAERKVEEPSNLPDADITYSPRPVDLLETPKITFQNYFSTQQFRVSSEKKIQC